MLKEDTAGLSCRGTYQQVVHLEMIEISALPPEFVGQRGDESHLQWQVPRPSVQREQPA